MTLDDLENTVGFDRRNCNGMPVNTFYPVDIRGTHRAIAICHSDGGCPVLTECRQYAIDNGEAWGVWGGMSNRQIMRYHRGEHTINLGEVAVTLGVSRRTIRRALTGDPAIKGATALRVLEALTDLGYERRTA